MRPRILVPNGGGETFEIGDHKNLSDRAVARFLWSKSKRYLVELVLLLLDRDRSIAVEVRNDDPEVVRRSRAFKKGDRYDGAPPVV